MKEFTADERLTIIYLSRGLAMLSSQVEAMLDPIDTKWARGKVAEKADAVIEVIREVQAILKEREGEE